MRTLQDLGIWSTQHFGRLPASVAASAALAAQPEGTGVARKLISGVWAAMKATVPHGGSPAVLLRHWWRLRCNDADAQSSQLTAPGNGTSRQVTSASGHTSSSSVGTMDLRGLGTATVSLVSKPSSKLAGAWRCNSQLAQGHWSAVFRSVSCS